MELRRFRAGDSFPSLTWPKVGGGELVLADERGWRMLVVYRGQHCPMCRKYLGGLNELVSAFQERDISVAAVSADSQAKAEHEAGEEGWRFPVAYDLPIDDMLRLGLYISEPESPKQTDRPFAEPALFVINPQGRTQVIAVTNAPFSRPDLAVVLEGLKSAQDDHAPIHGTAA